MLVKGEKVLIFNAMSSSIDQAARQLQQLSVYEEKEEWRTVGELSTCEVSNMKMLEKRNLSVI